MTQDHTPLEVPPGIYILNTHGIITMILRRFVNMQGRLESSGTIMPVYTSHYISFKLRYRITKDIEKPYV